MIHGEDNSTQHLEMLLHNLYKSCLDDEQEVVKKVVMLFPSFPVDWVCIICLVFRVGGVSGFLAILSSLKFGPT